MRLEGYNNFLKGLEQILSFCDLGISVASVFDCYLLLFSIVVEFTWVGGSIDTIAESTRFVILGQLKKRNKYQPPAQPGALPGLFKSKTEVCLLDIFSFIFTIRNEK